MTAPMALREQLKARRHRLRAPVAAHVAVGERQRRNVAAAPHATASTAWRNNAEAGPSTREYEDGASDRRPAEQAKLLETKPEAHLPTAGWPLRLAASPPHIAALRNAVRKSSCPTTEALASSPLPSYFLAGRRTARARTGTRPSGCLELRARAVVHRSILASNSCFCKSCAIASPSARSAHARQMSARAPTRGGRRRPGPPPPSSARGAKPRRGLRSRRRCRGRPSPPAERAAGAAVPHTTAARASSARGARRRPNEDARVAPSAFLSPSGERRASGRTAFVARRAGSAPPSAAARRPSGRW